MPTRCSYFVISVCIPARLKTVERLCTILGVQSGATKQQCAAVQRCAVIAVSLHGHGRDLTACQAPMDPAMLAAMMVQALCTVWRKHRPTKSSSFLFLFIVREKLGKYVHFCCFVNFDLLFVAISRRLSGMDTHITSCLLHVVVCSNPV